MSNLSMTDRKKGYSRDSRLPNKSTYIVPSSVNITCGCGQKFDPSFGATKCKECTYADRQKQEQGSVTVCTFTGCDATSNIHSVEGVVACVKHVPRHSTEHGYCKHTGKKPCVNFGVVVKGETRFMFADHCGTHTRVN